MAAMNENPYTWDKRSSDVTGKVVSLSFKSKGKKLTVSHLDKDDPIDILIPRDAPAEPPERFKYNCSIHKEWRIHKLVVDKNGSAVNVEVGMIGSDRQFVVYVRREKAPTIVNFDWRVISPNKTDHDRFDSKLNQNYPNDNKQESNTTGNVTKASGMSSNLTREFNQTNSQENNVTRGRDHLKIRGSNVSLFLSQTRLYVGTYYIGIRFTAATHFTSCDLEDYNVSYTLRTFKSKCLYWNEEFQKWKDDGCEVCMTYQYSARLQF